MVQAGVCKTLYPGSIPGAASIHHGLFRTSIVWGRGGGTGRRYGLKIRCLKGRAGSNPAPGTSILVEG